MVLPVATKKRTKKSSAARLIVVLVSMLVAIKVLQEHHEFLSSYAVLDLSDNEKSTKMIAELNEQLQDAKDELKAVKKDCEQQGADDSTSTTEVELFPFKGSIYEKKGLNPVLTYSNPTTDTSQEEGVLPTTININKAEKRENTLASQSEGEETAVLKEKLVAAKDELALLKAEREVLVAAFNNTVDATNETTQASSTDPQDETKKRLPLKPPFKILSIGEPRTGSTFQMQLLNAIISLKSPSNITIQKRLISKREGFHSLVASLNEESFLYKAHDLINDNNATAHVQKLAQDGDISLFTTFNDIEPSARAPKLSKSKFAVHSQTTSQLNSCSLCEVDRYKDIFNLTNGEVSHLRDYMSKYQIIRRCCGFQMSKYEMARLHGCDVQEYVEEASYPDCEIYNKTLVELQFAYHSSGTRYSGISSHNWENVGDCARVDNDIVENGKWFNGFRFRGCKAHGFKEASPL